MNQLEIADFQSSFEASKWENYGMTGLELGTLIECDMFAAIVVREDLLLICESESPDCLQEGTTIKMIARGPHAWSIQIYESYYDSMDFLIERDWKGNITADWTPDPWDDYEGDWDFEWTFDEPNVSLFEAFDDYRSLSSPAHIPRARRAFSDRHRSGGRRRR